MSAFFDAVIDLMQEVRSEKMLNIGCGEGFDIKHICEHKCSTIQQYFGFDLNIEGLRIARNMLPHLQFDAVCGDICHLPFKLDRFDLILCLEVLEHIRCPERVLKEITRQFNGHCILSVPNEPLYRLTRMVLFRLNIRDLGNHPEHLNNWSKNSFSRLIEKYFVIDQVITPFPWTIVLCRKKEK
jgi:SAM-dependent methyltransferase